MSSLFYFISEFFYNLRNHRLLSLGAILTSAFIWVILGFFVIVYFNLFQVYSTLRNDLKIVVYLKDGLSPLETKNLEDRIFSEREVLTVDLVPKEKALSEFKQVLKERGDPFQDIEGNPLPAFFEVKLKESSQSTADFSRFADKIRGNAGVEEIFYGKEWLEVLNRYVEFIQLMGIAVTFILVIGVFSMIGVIVRMTVYSRKEEILVLKYIGATQMFIQVPLLLEGAFLGLMSASVALGILYGLFNFITHYPAFHDLFSGTPVHSRFLPVDMILLFLATGPLLGAAGSYFPLQKYLRSFS